MFQTIWDFIISFKFQSPEAFWYYWVPVAACLFGFILDFFKDYQRDVIESTKSYYNPHLTWGSILGRTLVSFIPVINIGLFIFWHFWRIAKNFIELFTDWLDIPLVRHNPKMGLDAK